MEVYEAIKTRRSTRIYDKKEVERDKLNQIIEAGRFAPSGGNSQSTHFIVIQSEIGKRVAKPSSIKAYGKSCNFCGLIG